MGVAKSFIFDDLRFENEADWIRENGGLVVRLERPEAGTTTYVNHASERGIKLDPLGRDWIIKNDGSLEELRLKAGDVVKHIQEKVKKIQTDS
jgi:DNA-binding transcriptional MocR family regulator